MQDLELLARDKYDGDASRITETDRERLAVGEPLAYVIGWIPFQGLRIDLAAHPLIPRPETEWWTGELIERIGDRALSVLDLCAGSGAIGLAILKHCPNARVSFSDSISAYADLIARSIEVNGLDASRATIRTGDLLTPFPHESFDIIATNPPYIPETRELPSEVSVYEPPAALYAGTDGLAVIRRIAKNALHHLATHGEVWLEADVENIHEAAAELMLRGATRTAIKTDLFGRERIVLAYY